MGWLWSSSSQSGPKPSTDGGFIAPDRDQRAKCWEARDTYYNCLDKNGIIDPIKDDQKAKEACGLEEKGFEGQCAKSWVSLMLPPPVPQ